MLIDYSFKPIPFLVCFLIILKKYNLLESHPFHNTDEREYHYFRKVSLEKQLRVELDNFLASYRIFRLLLLQGIRYPVDYRISGWITVYCDRKKICHKIFNHNIIRICQFVCISVQTSITL